MRQAFATRPQHSGAFAAKDETAPGNHRGASPEGRAGLPLFLRGLDVSKPGDALEVEADRVADSAPGHSAGTVSWKSGGRDLPALPFPSSGRPLPQALRSELAPGLAPALERVRVHDDAQAARSAESLNARAYTIGRDIVFARGEYAPSTAGGRRLLAHELAHVAQQQGRGPSIQRDEALPAPPRLPDFAELFQRFEEHIRAQRLTEAHALVPDLLERMSLDDARRHAIDLAFWLMGRGDWEQARRALAELEDAWWLQYVTSSLVVDIAVPEATPRKLYERARVEALAGRHQQATHLLGLACVFAQMLLHSASQNRETKLQKESEALEGRPEESRAAVVGISSIGRIFSYQRLGGIYTVLRDILGLYPRLQREAIAAGDQDKARQYSGLGFLLRIEIRERYTLSNARALTMETAETQTPFGPGYTAVGRDITTTETVTPLPGTRTPAELGAYPTYGASMEDLLASIGGQEEYLTELFVYPEIRSEFRGALPNMSRLADRLRVWRTMLRVYQRDALFPLNSLMGLIRDYLQRFTFHSEYNIRDYGVSYLTSDFPEDLAGRAIRDCGVYALMTAYEVYHAARGASPRLNLDFRLYAMPEHVVLVIFDRDEDNFYIVNNNQILGPYRGNEIAEVARAYSAVFGRRFGVAPGVSVNLGSTDLGDAAFRRQAWQRYRVGAASGLRPELPPNAGPDTTAGEITHFTYKRYYEDLERFDRGSQRLAEQLNRLQADAARLNDSQAKTLLSSRLPDLVALGRALTLIFAQRGPQAGIIIDERKARAALGRGFQRQLPGIVGRQHIYVFTQAQRHPLARLAMALLRLQQLGGTLSAGETSLIQALRLISEFKADIEAYERAGRPAEF